MAKKKDQFEKQDDDAEMLVLRYLAQHPDFLLKYPEILMNHDNPERAFSGDNIIDFQKATIDILKTRLQKSEQVLQEYIKLGQENNFNLKRIELAICLLCQCESVEQFFELLDFDLPELLNIEGISILAAHQDLPPALAQRYEATGLAFYPDSLYDLFQSKQKKVVIGAKKQDYAYYFPQQAEQINSMVRVWLPVNANDPLTNLGFPAVVAFGSRHKRKFIPNQATDLLELLARMVVMTFNRLLLTNESA